MKVMALYYSDHQDCLTLCSLLYISKTTGSTGVCCSDTTWVQSVLSHRKNKKRVRLKDFQNINVRNSGVCQKQNQIKENNIVDVGWIGWVAHSHCNTLLNGTSVDLHAPEFARLRFRKFKPQAFTDKFKTKESFIAFLI